MFANHISDKELLFNIEKELSKLNGNHQTNQLENGQNTKIDMAQRSYISK
jgi:hypothetical protein